MTQILIINLMEFNGNVCVFRKKKIQLLLSHIIQCLFVTLVIVKTIGIYKMTIICNTPNNYGLDHETRNLKVFIKLLRASGSSENFLLFWYSCKNI